MVRLLAVGCLLAVVLGTTPPRVRRNEVVDVLAKTEDDEESNITSATNDTDLVKDASGKSPSTKTPVEGSADRPEFGVHGLFGLNYFTEHGRPYINCAVGNYSEQKNRTSSEAKTKKCFVESHRPLDHLACMVVLTYMGTDEQLMNDPDPKRNIDVQNQDCWTNQREAIQSCHKGNKCYVNKNELMGGKQVFCCCTEHNCNDVIVIGDASTNGEAPVAPQQPEVEAVPQDSGFSWIQGLVFAACILMVAAFVLLFVVCYKRRRGDYPAKRSPSSIAPEDDRLIVNGNEPLDIKFVERLGKGKYGDVYLGVWRRNANNELQVAVKQFSPSNSKSYLNEVMIFNELSIKNYQGKNILKFYACEQTSCDPGKIITEYHEMGNLHNYLKRNVITRQQEAISIMSSSLSALAYLHEERGYVHGNPKPAILHRDIKSHNILLRFDDNNKLPIGVLSDFGLSMKCSQGVFAIPGKEEKFNVVGTQIYMAPELIHGATDFSTSSFRAIDVYAMAIVMWEILSRTKMSPNDEVPEYQEPLSNYIRELKSKVHHNDNIIGLLREIVVEKKKRPEFRTEINQDPDMMFVKNTIEEMWEQEPDARITAALAHNRMEKVSHESSIGYHSVISGEHLETHRDGLPSSSASEADTASSKSDTLGQEEADEDQKTLHLPPIEIPGSEAIELVNLR